MALARSYLFAPGSDARLVARVFEAGSDAVVLDLEDAVPAAQKAAARERVAAAVAAREPASRPALFVRINAVAGSLWRADLAAVAGAALAGVRLPKVESADEVRWADAELGRLEAERGLPSGSIELFCTIESARGLLAAPEIAAASPRVRNLGFGAADYALDVGADPGDEQATLFARSLIVAASRAALLDPPVAPAYTRLDDEPGLRLSCEAARRLGFFGRSCLHPRQLAPVHEAFTPSGEELARARRVLAAYDRAAAAGSGSLALEDGEFVDAAVARRARRLIELAESVQEGTTH